MSHSGDITWEHCTKVDNTGKVQCAYCGKVMSGGMTRMKQHLGGIAGEVIACDKVPPQVKLYFKDLVEKGKGKKKAKLEQEGGRSGTADEELDREMKIAIRLSRQAVMDDERREMMRSGPGSGSRSDATYIRRSNTVREQARIDRREKVLRRDEKGVDFVLAKRLSVEMDQRKKTMLRAMREYEERKNKKTLMEKFYRGIEKFYGSIGIKYKSSHKETFKEFTKIIREEDKDPSPPSSSDDVNVVIEEEDDSSSSVDGSNWYNR